MRHLAIRRTHPTVVTIDGADLATDAEGNLVLLDEDLIALELSVIAKEREDNAYKALRLRAYPSLAEQADMAYWDRKNGTTTLDDAIEAVKKEFPKNGF